MNHTSQLEAFIYFSNSGSVSGSGSGSGSGFRFRFRIRISVFSIRPNEIPLLIHHYLIYFQDILRTLLGKKGKYIKFAQVCALLPLWKFFMLN